MDKCPSCGGTGQLTCLFCQGAGYYREVGPHRYSPVPDEAERVELGNAVKACFLCGTKGFKTCGQCEGTGWFTPPDEETINRYLAELLDELEQRGEDKK